EMLGYVMGGGDVATEHHGVVTVFYQRADMLNECGQLGIAGLAGQTLRFSD
ncbi:hypothetical protein IH729_23860, partial [Escherichia coli]|nr:hypothetical protein [Escherichia coli]